jgi:hypothetical protein
MIRDPLPAVAVQGGESVTVGGLWNVEIHRFLRSRLRAMDYGSARFWSLDLIS